MFVVASSCPDCGVVEVPIVKVLLHIRDVPDRTRYSFTCPRCAAWISRPASRRDVTVLRDHCCPERRERVPRELLEEHSGPPVTLDDLIEFGLQLQACDLIAMLAGRP